MNGGWWMADLREIILYVSVNVTWESCMPVVCLHSSDISNVKSLHGPAADHTLFQKLWIGSWAIAWYFSESWNRIYFDIILKIFMFVGNMLL